MHLDENLELARENRLVLYVVQALLGMITANFIAVSIRFGSERLVVNFWLREHSAETDDDIDEILADMDSYMENEPLRLESEVHIGRPPAGLATRTERMVYLAKEGSG